MSCISLKVLVASTLLNLLVMPLSSVLAIVFGYIALLSSILLPIELLRNNKVCINKKQIWIIIVFVSSVAFNLLISLTVIPTDEVENIIKALISFLAFLLAISAKDITYRESDLNFYFSVIRFFAVVMILYTIIPFDFQYVIVNNYGSKQFTLSMGNPNATAAKNLFAIVILGIEIGMSKSKYLLWCNVFLIVGLMYCVEKLQSRTSMMCAIFFIVFALVLKLRVKQWMLKKVWIIPAVFIPIQIMFSRIPVLKFLDKSLATGREEMYIEFLEILSSSPFTFIFGDFVENQLGNSHNIFFALIFNFGFIGLILFLWFWKIEARKFDVETKKLAQYAWMGWIVFVIHSMAEAAVLSGAFTFGVIIILLNRMSKDEILISSDCSKYDWTIRENLRKAES